MTWIEMIKNYMKLLEFEEKIWFIGMIGEERFM